MEEEEEEEEKKKKMHRTKEMAKEGSRNEHCYLFLFCVLFCFAFFLNSIPSFLIGFGEGSGRKQTGASG